MIKFLKILFVSLLLFNTVDAQISTKEVKKLLEKHKIKHADKVLKLSILETGWYTSRKAIQDKNLFGFETGIKVFNTYEESVKAYKARVESRMKKGENFYKFLKRIKYADDKQYIQKIKKIKIKEIEYKTHRMPTLRTFEFSKIPWFSGRMGT